ncbi:MAG: class I SAM-dependent methyltransferase [Deltaproteobacteria bacterium]|nr:class I SAM-dependent methyltransferase [Deltaproteobacteria bacterium]
MKLLNFKHKIRRTLDFLLTLLFFGNSKLLFSLLRAEGVSSYIENEFLFKCACNGYGKGLIVEIGSFKGRSTIALALGSKAKGREKVYAVDPLDDLRIRELFIKNVKQAEVEDYVIPNYTTSEEAVRNFNSAVRLLFIDGSHKYQDVKKDILLWKDYLIDGGIILMHDYLPKDHPFHLPDVNRAVDELIINSDDFIVEGCIDSILFASKKKSENKKIFRLYNKFHKIRKYLKSLVDTSWLRC